MNGHLRNIAAIVLAAGGSSRLGRPKQLLTLSGKSFVVIAAEKCLEAGCRTVVVVTGHKADEVRASVAELPVTVVENEAWADGQATSIVAGMRAIATEPASPDTVLVLLCDTPHIAADDLRRLLDACSRATPIAATRYTEGGGVPACFRWELRGELLRLSGDQGARELIRGGRYPLTLCELSGAELDVDSPQDLALYVEEVGKFEL